MKKIINPWAGKPEYNCFGCSPDNPIGLHMHFCDDGDDVVGLWRPSPDFQGWVDTLHGGVLSTLIDETCGWVVTRKKQTCGFTTSLSVKFRRPVSTGESQLTIRAHIVGQARNLLMMHASVTNAAGQCCAEGDVTYYLVGPEQARAMGFDGCRVEE